MRSRSPADALSSTDLPPKLRFSNSTTRGGAAAITTRGGVAAIKVAGGAAAAVAISRTDATLPLSDAFRFAYAPGWSCTQRPWKFASVHTCQTPSRITIDVAVLLNAVD